MNGVKHAFDISAVPDFGTVDAINDLSIVNSWVYLHRVDGNLSLKVDPPPKRSTITTRSELTAWVKSKTLILIRLQCGFDAAQIRFMTEYATSSTQQIIKQVLDQTITTPVA